MPDFPHHHSSSLFTIVPVIIFLVFAFVVIKGLAEWASNNAKPILSEPARISGKRTRTSGGEHPSTYHYVTFELETGERNEFRMSGWKYGQLSEGDRGTLVYQGTRFHEFTRGR